MQMQAELQFLSPLVPAREVVFFRYCVHNADEGSWCIVDFPADGFQEELLQQQQQQTCSVVRCRRRPSGCIIQDAPNGYSRVRTPITIHHAWLTCHRRLWCMRDVALHA
jgi:hypothetical protein